jgi:hypothetical protein
MKNTFIFYILIIIIISFILFTYNKQVEFFYENKLEFIHIPKTGGSSIEKLGKKYNINWGMYNKNYLIETKKSSSIWHQISFLYKNNNFTLIRNPYDRIISEFFYRYKIITNNKNLKYNKLIYIDNPNQISINEFKLWLNESLKKYNISKYIYDSHLIPQSEYIYDKNGNQRIEYIFKLEDDFKNNLDHLFKKYNLNININDLSHYNVTDKTFNKYDLDQYTLDIIYNFYETDFINFNYEKLLLKN